LRKHLFARIVALAIMATAALAFASSAFGQNYVVLYKQQAVPADAAAAIQKAGGTFVYAYPQIGVVIARSDSASFRTNLLKDSKIENATGTAGYGIQVDGTVTQAGGPPPGDLPNAPASDAEPLFGLQWDMRQIHTPEAHAITGGSPTVLAGDIDTGIDFTHPDLAPNIDVANSVNCVNGVPVPGLAAQDDNGHGTHTAGTIAAAANGIGIVGVAPKVKIAGIKAGNADGFFFPEAVVCSFIWAGTHHVDVTNNSYFADPWLFNCKNDPVQRAIWKAEQRAIKFAQQSGVTVVASEGNQSEDISHPTQDDTSPDDSTPIENRSVTNACVVIPVEIPGVVGVTADGANTQTDGDADPNDYLKSYYSSFGISTADVVAPGGDRRFGINPAAGALNGRVLSTWPASLAGDCPASLTVVDGGAFYCYLQGTSMAGPHVAGVAALVVSRYGRLAGPGNATMQPGHVSSIVQATADEQPCPTELPTTNPVDGRSYLSFIGVDDEKVQTCEGGAGQNSWYGRGQVNALNAVTHTVGG
jgi:lantibiotic leader peptide-processing serine protease